MKKIFSRYFIIPLLLVLATVPAFAQTFGGGVIPQISASLVALSSYNTNCLVTQTAANAFTGRTITGTANQITVTNGCGSAGNPTISLPVTITGLTSISSTGFTGALTGNASTATALQTGRAINGVTFDGTAGITVTASATTLTGQVPVASGGTGDATLTAYAPLFGGTTTTGAVQSGTVGTAGQVLTSNGAGALPTMQSNAGRLLNIQVFTASATYTPTAGTNTDVIYAIGAGGGGGGSGSSGGGTGGTGGTTSLGALISCTGGVGGLPSNGNGGAGGTCTSGTVNIVGGTGEASSFGVGGQAAGGHGAASPFGGGATGGQGSAAGAAAPANSGSGGGGAGPTVSIAPGAGGGAGGYGVRYATGITGTYSATIGAVGSAGSSGTGGTAGGAGGTGLIIIYEYN